MTKGLAHFLFLRPAAHLAPVGHPGPIQLLPHRPAQRTIAEEDAILDLAAYEEEINRPDGIITCLKRGAVAEGRIKIDPNTWLCFCHTGTDYVWALMATADEYNGAWFGALLTGKPFRLRDVQ